MSSNYGLLFDRILFDVSSLILLFAGVRRDWLVAVWVSTRVQGAKYGQATRTGFQVGRHCRESQDCCSAVAAFVRVATGRYSTSLLPTSTGRQEGPEELRNLSLLPGLCWPLSSSLQKLFQKIIIIAIDAFLRNMPVRLPQVRAVCRPSAAPEKELKMHLCSLLLSDSAVVLSMATVNGEHPYWYCALNYWLYCLGSKLHPAQGSSRLDIDSKYLTSMWCPFQRLFNYISGQNEAELRMQMTAPVRERVSESGGEIESDIITSFFIPFEYQASTNL